MQVWVSYPAYILGLFAFGPSQDQSRVVAWTLQLLRIVLFLLLTRRFIAPFILAKVSTRIRVRSISLRSIRGLYYKQGDLAWNVDRIGLAYHRPTKERPRRFAIQVEGLRLNVLHIPGLAQNGAPSARESATAIHRRLSSLFVQPHTSTPVVSHPNWRSSLLTLVRVLMDVLDPFVRPLLRALFVAVFRLIIRSLPALTQVLEFEMDSGVVSFEVLRGAHLRVAGITVTTQVQFEGLDQIMRASAIEGSTTSFKFASFAGLNTRMRASAGRLWDRGWANTRGAASIAVKVSEVVGSTQPFAADVAADSPIAWRPQHTVPGRSGVFFAIRYPVDFRAALRFNPRRMKVEPHSLDCSVDLAGIDIMADVLQALVDLVEEAQRSAASSPTEPSEPARSFSPPTSPLLGAWSEMSRNDATDLVVPKNRKPSAARRLAPFVKNLRLGLQSVNLTFRTSGRAPYLYRLSLDTLAMQACISNPRNNRLHQKWLGSLESKKCLEGVVFSITSDLRSLALERSGEPGLTDIWMPLASIQRVDLRTMVTGAVLAVKTRKQLFTGDPNSAFIACELVVDDVQMSERLDAINESLSQAEQTVTSPRTKQSKLVHDAPRICIDVLVNNIELHLLRTADSVSDREIGLHTRTDGFELHVQSAFSPCYLQQPLGMPATTSGDHSPTRMQFQCTTILHPLFTRMSIEGLPEHLQEVAKSPFFSIDMIELFVSGDAHALPTDNTAVFNVASVMSEIACVTDAISVELWDPARVTALAKLVSSFPVRPAPQKQATALLDVLPSGINARVSVRDVVVVVTGQDLNPQCDLELNRGLALRTSVSVSYCFMHTVQHFERTKVQRLRNGNRRQRLGLQEDLVVQAVAIAKTHSPEDMAALFSMLIWRTSCRVAVATELAADHEGDADTFGVPHSPTGTAVLSTPVIVGRFTLERKYQRAFFESHHYTDSCSAVIDITSLSATFNLLNVYCALLAARTLQSLVPRRPKVTSRPKSQLQLLLKAKVEAFDVFCGFSQGQRLFMRADGLAFEHSPKHTHAGCRFVKAFVPCIADSSEATSVPNQWDELLHIKGFSASLNDSVTLGRHFDLKAESLRLRVASGFKIADLILDVTVAVKAAKHLFRLVLAGEFFTHAAPEAEAAKRVPHVKLHISVVLLDAEDLALDRKLNLIWQAGFDAQRVRLEREYAFEAKCAAIRRDTPQDPLSDVGTNARYKFTPKHTVSIADARERLNMAHSSTWLHRILQVKTEQVRREEAATRPVRDASSYSERPYPILRRPVDSSTPLVRIRLSELRLDISPPHFEAEELPSFLHDLGSGIPYYTQYSLLVPLHIEASIVRGSVELRDYPLPLLLIPKHPGDESPAFEFSTDLVVAEEMGPDFSVKWVNCLVVPANSGIPGASAMQFAVPKTAMPVKTYARPAIRVSTSDMTHISWGVSYLPAMQEVLRFLDTLTTPPEDNANPIGFWDKLRLVFHWQITAHFTGPVRFIFKGSRDPHHIVGSGAGFALCWQGGTTLTVGYNEKDKELVQVTSDTMQFMIPDLQFFAPLFEGRRASVNVDPSGQSNTPGMEKTCAKFTNGVRMGLGFILERTCAPKCADCPEDPFHRRCRFFTFKPHYEVQLRAHPSEHVHDSFQGFRSDFIHMSFSLTTPTMPPSDQTDRRNNIYLSPRAFSHFWQWWELFDNSMAIRIRQGKLYPNNVKETKKFGRFIASIKYRFSLERLFITHVYKHETRDAWNMGETPFIGVKAFMQSLHADLHQCNQEILSRREGKPATVTMHKKFNAVEVVIGGVEMRALAAVFAEPHKQLIAVKSATCESLRPWDDMKPHDGHSSWVDMDDFVELLWAATDKKPRIYLSHLASCPRFTFSRHGACREPWSPPSQLPGLAGSSAVSKFGAEDTHVCLLGKEQSAKEIQLDLASQRLQELMNERDQFASSKIESDSPTSTRSSSSIDSDDDVPTPNRSAIDTEQSLNKKIELLEAYIQQLGSASASRSEIYYMPADSVDASAWAEFANVYHIHSPNIFINNSNRNLLFTYYQASRRRRGFEYHLATRAVKYLHDIAAEEASRTLVDENKRPWKAVDGAQAAVEAFRHFLVSEKTSYEASSDDHSAEVLEPFDLDDPLRGFHEGVAVAKGHYCVLFKPQFVLQSENSEDACIVVAASDVSSQNFRIIDLPNQDDPITGHIMHRNHAAVNGLQVFSPNSSTYSSSGRKLSPNVPLEVLVDYRCDSNDFDRIVPQTEATFHYDKFNRNRPRASASQDIPAHIAHHMDLVLVNMPRFAVAAKPQNFDTISSVVTDLLLFSDPANRSRVERLENFLFSYDFSDLNGAADLISSLQTRIRQLLQIERGYALRNDSLDANERLDLLAVSAQIFVLGEELNLVFDAISMAQDQNHDLHDDQQSALKLVVSSKEISWHMLDDRAVLLAKLEVLGVYFAWLSKQDSSTSSQLRLTDMRALHSSPTAFWPEILMKYDGMPSHPMAKRELFALAEWAVLPPVAGIAIYQNFELEVHPIRLQIEAEVGAKLLEYFWPSRRAQNGTNLLLVDDSAEFSTTADSSNASLNRTRTRREDTLDVHGGRSLARPRSHTNLRVQARPTLHKFKSSTALNEMNDVSKSDDERGGLIKRKAEKVDASEMRSRSSAKTFIRVMIPPLHVMLSARSDDFVCNEALLYTRPITFQNRTTSFEEIVQQFIPQDLTWKGWVRMALKQEVVPVIPIAKELFTKTKWGSKAAASQKNLLRTGTTASNAAPPGRPKNLFGNLRRKTGDSDMQRLRSRSRGRTSDPALPTSPRPELISISVQEPSPNVEGTFL